MGLWMLVYSSVDIASKGQQTLELLERQERAAVNIEIKGLALPPEV